MDNTDLLRNLFESNTGDITLIFKNNNSKKVHKSILEFHSNVFKSMFASGMKESKAESINIPNFEEEHMIYFLKLVYGDNDIKQLNISQLFQLVQIADFYDCKGIHDFLINKLEDLTIDKNLEEMITAYYQFPDISQKIKIKIFKLLSQMFHQVYIRGHDDIRDYTNCEQQFEDNCYDLIKPGQFERNLISKYYTCCKHKSLSKTYLSVASNLTVGNHKCCIDPRVTEINDKVCVVFCCEHRTFVVPENRIKFLKEYKTGFDKSYADYQIIKPILEKMPEYLKIELFDYFFYII